MFSPYRKLFAVPGALRFSIAGSIARLPISMTLLSITFVIVHVKHSYTLAGTVKVAAFPVYEKVDDEAHASEIGIPTKATRKANATIARTARNDIARVYRLF